MQQGDIVLINLPQVLGETGHEQVGQRPALVVHNNATISQLSVIMIIPLTTQLNAANFPHTLLLQPSIKNGLDFPSVLLIFQLRAIDKSRVVRTIGQLESSIYKQVIKDLRKLLDIP